jgi:hypothetical protein
MRTTSDFHCKIARFAEWMVDLKENNKFREEACKNLGDLVKKMKETHGVKYLIPGHRMYCACRVSWSRLLLVSHQGLPCLFCCILDVPTHGASCQWPTVGNELGLFDALSESRSMIIVRRGELAFIGYAATRCL